jgi:hypothetical protein
MSFMDVMYGPLGQVNNQFQANLGQNAAAMGQQQNFYGDLSNAGAYNQYVTDNLYGPGGFGGDTAKYAYAGAAYGRNTGGFGGYGGYSDPYGGAGADQGTAGWGSQPMDSGYYGLSAEELHALTSGAPSSFNDRYSFGAPYSGLPPEIMTGQSDPYSWSPSAAPYGGIRSGMGGGAWDTQDQWGRGYTPPVQNYGGDPMAAYRMGGGGALPDYNGDMWGGNSGYQPAQGYFDTNTMNWVPAPSFNDRYSSFSPGTGSAYGPGYFDNTFGSANDMQQSRDAIAQAWMNQQMAGGDSRYTRGGDIYMFGASPGSGNIGGATDTFSGWDYQRGTPGGFDQRYYAPQGPMGYNQGVDELARLYNETLNFPPYQPSTYSDPDIFKITPGGG